MNNGSSSSPTIINCQFINCFGNQGGALDNYRSSVTVSGSTFMSNNAAHEGQAIYNRESCPNFISCDFINNGDGGDPDQVIVNTGTAQMSFAGCTFEGNRGAGTGVISSNSSLPVTLKTAPSLATASGTMAAPFMLREPDQSRSATAYFRGTGRTGTAAPCTSTLRKFD
jgi:hypothetical protein